MAVNFLERTFHIQIGRKYTICLLTLCCLSNFSCAKQLDLHQEGEEAGSGNEVRISFVTTLAPEWDYMNATTYVNKGFRNDSFRFFMKAGLLWGNVKEMLNYGVGISFHDVKTVNEDDKDAILPHYKIAQDELLNKLSGRGCKMLAEPSGHRAYCDAALEYPPIQTMTAQSTPNTVLYPHQPAKDLNQVIIYRPFFDQTAEDNSPSPEIIKKNIIKELQKSETERPAIYGGAHNTDTQWGNFLLWLNDEYCKDGLDNVWMPNQEEYYEYNYYRIHSTINEPIAIDDQTLQLTLNLPSGEFFYYPSITINLPNITMDEIATIETNNTVTGLSYADYKDGIMLNIDCRKHLAEHAENFVKRYEKDSTDESAKADAIYFASMLKESEKKNELLNRIN